MSSKDAGAKIKINKLLEESGWRFFDDQNGKANVVIEPNIKLTAARLAALGNDFEKASQRFVNFLLLDEQGSPLFVLAAKSESKNPLLDKEQASKYAQSQNCRFVILSNGNLHYFWDLQHGNPYAILLFPGSDNIKDATDFKPKPKKIVTESLEKGMIIIPQRASYANVGSFDNKTEKMLVNIKRNMIFHIEKEYTDNLSLDLGRGTGRVMEGSSMNLQQAYYEQKFENEFLRSKGTTFQGLFEKLMGFAYKSDFMACRPWGNRGDRKNDGFLKSERRLFQVYAPYELTEAAAISKIKEDFEGAKDHWQRHFDKWVFAHNATEGLPPHVQSLLLDLEIANPGITLEPWCLEEFRTIFRQLSNDDLMVWFGSAPTAATKTNLGFADLQVVLQHLSGQSTASVQQVKDVPSGKIEANALSESVATLLREGMSKTPLVARFFEQWHNPVLGESIARSFRTKYESLRENYAPNRIFSELQAWSGGVNRGTPEHELAVLTVMAYYFERCDIFEEPRRGAP